MTSWIAKLFLFFFFCYLTYLTSKNHVQNISFRNVTLLYESSYPHNLTMLVNYLFPRCYPSSFPECKRHFKNLEILSCFHEKKLSSFPFPLTQKELQITRFSYCTLFHTICGPSYISSISNVVEGYKHVVMFVGAWNRKVSEWDCIKARQIAAACVVVWLLTFNMENVTKELGSLMGNLKSTKGKWRKVYGTTSTFAIKCCTCRENYVYRH
jgi:hypothetical protein